MFRIKIMVGIVLFAGSATAIEPVRLHSANSIHSKAFRADELYIGNVYQPLSGLPEQASTTAAARLESLGIEAGRARIDSRTDRFGTLLPGKALLSARASAPIDKVEEQAWDAFVDYLQRNRGALRIDSSQLPARGRVTVHAGGLIQIHAQRHVAGIPVRDAFLSATIKNGRLSLLGARNWGDGVPQQPARLTIEVARQRLGEFLDPIAAPNRVWGKPRLELIPVSRGELGELTIGSGLAYRLAWVIEDGYKNQPERWQALVDAHDGEILALEDQNQHATPRKAAGGVLPRSNDGVSPDGIEQVYPMPFLDFDVNGSTLTTNSGGSLAGCHDGTVSTALSGPYVTMNDNCGAISESSTGDIDLGTNAGTDCTVPAGASAGDTRSSRTGFFELNRIIEMARSHLPGNAWLQSTLTANMNINSTCNAFWSGSVNFYRSGGGCNNTGEIAGVFDHEWGHGMDDNDANPTISSPGEGIADIYAALRLDDSCIGRNFFGSACSGYGDPCDTCTGVRDIDWDKRASGAPHDITWIDANCGGGSAPCGGSVHCEGAAYSEAVWDLVNRDLPATYGMDHTTAHEIGTRLTYLGAGPVGNWFSCVSGSGGDGCNADGGYLNYLAADDDDGDLGNGTPHMTAIFAAFDRHGIACATPTVQDSGCAGRPALAPTVATSGFDRGVSLSWAAITGATAYNVYRTDGAIGCDFGKVLLSTTTATSFDDFDLANGHDYNYTVAAVGTDPGCLGPLSACTAVTPSAGANLDLNSLSITTQALNGDLDPFYDNCEEFRVDFDLESTGGSHTNPRIVSAQILSGGSSSILSSLPTTGSDLASACDFSSQSLNLQIEGMAQGESIQLQIGFTSDELGVVKTTEITLDGVESDWTSHASLTYDFETDLEGWALVDGTFARSSARGGGDGTATGVQSSAFLDEQCDRIQSPVLQLAADSTLDIWTRYDMEDFSDSWYDRAQVAIIDGATRSVVSPDSGRAYEASGAFGQCVTANLPGWASVNDTWASSGFSATALGSAGLAGNQIQLELAHGTDFALNGAGFVFDQVTLTNVLLAETDAQGDTCVVGNIAPTLLDDSVNLLDTVTPADISVLLNDSDDDSDPLRVLAVSTPSLGTATINLIGPNIDTITYSPGPSFVGSDSFTYSVSDGRGGSAIATVTIGLIPVELEMYTIE